MKVVLQVAVNHDGTDVAEGSTLDLPKAQAEQLVAGGAAVYESDAKFEKALASARAKLDDAQVAFTDAKTDADRAKAQTALDKAQAEIDKLSA